MASRSVTSSRELEDGVGHSGSQAGMINDPSGQAPAHASHLALQDFREASQTNVISGQATQNLSENVSLQSCLENRLRARLRGSVSCEVIWKKWDTPWGQCLSKPRARVRIISGIDIGLWPTVTSNSPAKNYNEAGNSAGQVALRKIILALWPTATSRDWKDGDANSCKNVPVNCLLGRAIHLGMWSTLRATDGEKGGPNMSFGAGGSPLPSQVSTECSSSNAPTESGGGSLHPEFAGWEMGYPPEWLSCAPSETLSSRKRRKRL
jgi:hypothetical protein